MITGKENVDKIYIVSNKAEALEVVYSVAKIDLTYNNKIEITIPKSIDSEYTSIIDKNPVYCMIKDKQVVDLVAIIYDKDIEKLNIKRADIKGQLEEFLR